MASIRFFAFLLSPIFLIQLIKAQADFACPFNPIECTCTGNPGSTRFYIAKCRSRNSIVSKFNGSGWTVSEELVVGSNGHSVQANAFAAFKSIGLLTLEQSYTLAPEKQTWEWMAFAGPKIEGFATVNISGVIPPPGELKQRAGSLKKLLVSNCRETVYLTGPNIFSDFTNLNVLLIKDTPIHQDIHDAAFAGLENNLTELWLLNTALPKFPSNAVSRLTKLYRLDLTDSGINSFASQDFAPFKELIFLILDGNNAQAALESGALHNIPKSVTTLFLERGKLTAVPNIISDSPQVTILALSYNQITTVKNGDFPNGNGLVYLEMPGNPITSIESGAFRYLTELTSLILYDTQLPSFDLSLLNGMNKLRYLGLDGNQQLKTLTVSNADQVPANVKIDLRDTTIENIDPKMDVLLNRPNFQFDMSNNKHINCSQDLRWMAKHVQCEPINMFVYNSNCSEGGLLSDYLKTIVPNACGDTSPTTPTAAPPTSPTGAPGSSSVAPPTSPTPTGSPQTGSPSTEPSAATSAATGLSSPATSPKNSVSSITANIFLTISMAAVFTSVCKLI